MGIFLRDLKHAFRTLRQSPTFTATAVLALVVGIGTNIAIFSVIDTVVLRPVAAPDPERVVVFTTTSPTGPQLLSSPVKFNFWRQQTADPRLAGRNGVSRCLFAMILPWR
jgi:putative ABC transport system permease protein